MLTLILCAAGSGKRAGSPENKILHDLNGMPVLCHALSAFDGSADEILVPCREEDEKTIVPLLSQYGNTRPVRGGATRAESVFHALKIAKGDIVLIHDAARPFVTRKIVADCISSVETFGSGVCALPATDTAVLAAEGKIGGYVPRDFLFTVQTPQGFRREELLSAYLKAEQDGTLATFTDDSGVYAQYVAPPHLFLGDRCNRKITYPEDLMPAERVGFGVDTHAFAHQDEIDRGIARLNLNHITLCGVVIPSNRALEAHSDGDVAVHALMDALLSAIGERDIGYHFPDADPQYKGIKSMILLGRVMDMVRGKMLKVQNVSISILCELPRLSPYIEEMRKNLSAALGCDNIGIAAGTNEKLGYVGEGRGITCYAMVLLSAQ